jgi:hypothetical protein
MNQIKYILSLSYENLIKARDLINAELELRAKKGFSKSSKNKKGKKYEPGK